MEVVTAPEASWTNVIEKGLTALFSAPELNYVSTRFSQGFWILVFPETFLCLQLGMLHLTHFQRRPLFLNLSLTLQSVSEKRGLLVETFALLRSALKRT